MLVATQEAVALMGEQAADTQKTQPATAAPYSQVQVREAGAAKDKAAAGEDSLYEGRTVHSGCGYDLGADAADPAQHDVRAVQVKEALEGAVLEGIQKRYGYRFAKRTFDVVFSALMIVLFCWLFALIAVLIKIDDPKGPVFFKQKRVGRLDANGNPTYFTMYKFMSMCVDAESKLPELRELNEKTGPVFKIADDPRVTRVGKWLRKLSLAPVIFAPPGSEEPTNSFLQRAKTHDDLHIYKRRPGISPAAENQYTSSEKLSFGVFGGSVRAVSPLSFGAEVAA